MAGRTPVEIILDVILIVQLTVVIVNKSSGDYNLIRLISFGNKEYWETYNNKRLKFYRKEKFKQ